MSQRFIIAGTDTEIGKTVFAAGLMLGLEAWGTKPHYWKPVQSGIEDGVDTRRVQKLTALPDERFLPERYIFSQSLSPHRAAELDKAKIDIALLRDPSVIPSCDGPLLIEGAGGLMVPLSRENLQVNLYKDWDIPVILCARTGLGTINHTLLSLEALWARRMNVLGVAFIGPENADNITTISEFSKARILGHLPWLERLEPQRLKEAFLQNFDQDDFIV